MEGYLYYLRRIWFGMGLLLAVEAAVLLGTGRAVLIPSILLGGCGSFIYGFMLAHRVKQVTEIATNDAAVSYMRAGLALRLMFVGLVGLMALKIPGFYIIPVLLGLFTLPIIIHIYSFLAIMGSILFKND